MKIFLVAIMMGLTSPYFGSVNTSKTIFTEKYVSFTLRNGSLKDIPLIIPGVMNPNLSPMGNSGISLKVGQEILFKFKGKKRILLVVEESLEGKTIEVQKILKIRKEEIESKL